MRSYLVVGNQTLDSPELEAVIVDRMATGPATFHIVVPATPIQSGLTWDEERRGRRDVQGPRSTHAPSSAPARADLLNADA